MCCVGAHEDEGTRLSGDASKTTEVPDRVARSIQEVEATIIEKVEGFESADANRLLKIHLPQVTPLEIRFENHAIGIAWVCLSRNESFFEPGTNNERCRGWEFRWISCVVVMPVAPDNAVDGGAMYVDPVFRQYFLYVLGHLNVPPRRVDNVENRRRQVLPVFAAAQVEKQAGVCGRVMNQE